VAIEFFTDALLDPYIEGGSPAQVNWQCTAFDGDVMTIQRNGQNLYGGPGYAGWVRYAGSVADFPKYVEVVFSCSAWAYIDAIDIWLWRNGEAIVADTIIGDNGGAGIPYPENQPGGGGPFSYHWEPRWYWDRVDELFDGTYESYASHAGFLVVTVQPRSTFNPTLSLQLREYQPPPEPGLFWTGYVKARETLTA